MTVLLDIVLDFVGSWNWLHQIGMHRSNYVFHYELMGFIFMLPRF